MKILFLDIDGVLNNESTKEVIDTVFGPFTGIDRRLLQKLKDWLQLHPEVQIVLSSSWRLDDRYNRAFRNHLESLGISWISETPNIGFPRGREIASWLDKNKWTHYAILDDYSDMHPVGAGLVQTSSRRGLEDKHLRRITELLALE